MAHRHGVLVEAPLGKIGTVGKESEAKYDHDAVTDPELVEEFTTKTGVDILAVSVGTTHGRAAGESHLDYERLQKICNNTDVFISLHGGSGVADDSYRRAISIGVEKISIFTRVSTAAVDEIPGTSRAGQKGSDGRGWPSDRYFLEPMTGVECIRRSYELYGN